MAADSLVAGSLTAGPLATGSLAAGSLAAGSLVAQRPSAPSSPAPSSTAPTSTGPSLSTVQPPRAKPRARRQWRHLVLAQPVHVRAVEAGRRRGRHHDLGHAGGAARFDHVQRTLVVHLEVERPRMERADCRRVVPHAVGAGDQARDSGLVADVAHDVLDARVAPRVGRRLYDVEHTHRLRAALDSRFLTFEIHSIHRH